MSAEATYWNGERCEAERVRVVVGDTGRFANYWARPFVGQVREAVRIRYGGATFYIDNADGEGWAKVTAGGGPGMPHSSLEIERVA